MKPIPAAMLVAVQNPIPLEAIRLKLMANARNIPKSGETNNAVLPILPVPGILPETWKGARSCHISVPADTILFTIADYFMYIISLSQAVLPQIGEDGTGR
jgi:hypothetical protein